MIIETFSILDNSLNGKILLKTLVNNKFYEGIPMQNILQN